jgi:hypothetical protein
VAVGTDHIGQHLGVPSVRLGPRTAMAAAVAAHHLRVNRIDLIAGRQQHPNQQAPVGLNPDDDLGWILGMSSHQGMQRPDSGEAIGDTPGCKHIAVLVEQAQVMVALALVDPEEQHPGPPLLRHVVCEPEKDLRRPNGSAHRHDIPPAVRPPQHRPGHGLPRELQGSQASECSPAGSSAVASHRRLVQPH